MHRFMGATGRSGMRNVGCRRLDSASDFTVTGFETSLTEAVNMVVLQNLVALNRAPSSIERSKTLAGIHPPLDPSMVLFHNIV